MGCAVQCAEVDELIDEEAAMSLLWIERVRLFAHLLTCRPCRARLAGAKRAV